MTDDTPPKADAWPVEMGLKKPGKFDDYKKSPDETVAVDMDASDIRALIAATAARIRDAIRTDSIQYDPRPDAKKLLALANKLADTGR